MWAVQSQRQALFCGGTSVLGLRQCQACSVILGHFSSAGRCKKRSSVPSSVNNVHLRRNYFSTELCSFPRTSSGLEVLRFRDWNRNRIFIIFQELIIPIPIPIPAKIDFLTVLELIPVLESITKWIQLRFQKKTES